MPDKSDSLYFYYLSFENVASFGPDAVCYRLAGPPDVLPRPQTEGTSLPDVHHAQRLGAADYELAVSMGVAMPCSHESGL